MCSFARIASYFLLRLRTSLLAAEEQCDICHMQLVSPTLPRCDLYCGQQRYSLCVMSHKERTLSVLFMPAASNSSYPVNVSVIPSSGSRWKALASQ